MEKPTEHVRDENAPEIPAAESPAVEQRATQSYPLVPLKNTVIFPGARVTLNIGREKSILAIRHAIKHGSRFVASAQRQADLDSPGPDDVFPICTIVRIAQHEVQNDDTLQLIVDGVARAHIAEWDSNAPYLRVAVEEMDEAEPEGAQAEALVRHAHSLFDRFSHLSRRFSADDIAGVTALHTPGKLADNLAGHVIADHTQQQELLETLDPLARLEKICVSLGNEIEILELENKIRQRVRQQVDKNQREYYLKEQLRAIQEELGNDQASEVAELREKVSQKGLPADIATKVNKELDRLDRMPTHSAELVVLRNYIDWVLALPWQERTEDRLDMDYAQHVLDEDHYGLEKVKDRIIEFLAVRQLRMMQAQREAAAEGNGNGNGHTDTDEPVPARSNAHKGPILCLVGPPGVGKTSLGQSVARALGRNFVRISLGGVHDEAEIRGHRRTYVGAQPGRLVRALREAGTMNPVILLDEVDKLGADYRGDPSSALLEVLDPAQNHTFRDHYLEVELDLSKVLFLATANVAETIPGPLYDRLEVIRLDGYTDDEKLSIARHHLLPRQLERAALRPDEVEVDDEVLRSIVSDYTREAGVRSLERQLGRLLRKVATRLAEGAAAAPVKVEVGALREWLGRPGFYFEAADRTAVPGVATGLAVTGTGGDVLYVEATAMNGDGLSLTGQLGDVMKESAEIALSYVRSHAAELGIDPRRLEARRFHLHVPAGAVPKDGPSAGVTMTTALVSLLSDRAVRSSVGMTGEVTLQGLVLPIGGVKQKVLAAHRAGLTEVVLPARNGPDLEDVPEAVRESMTFHLASQIEDVLSAALEPAVSSSTGEEATRAA